MAEEWVQEANQLIESLKLEVQQLKDEVMVLEHDRLEAEKNREILEGLYDKQVIDEDGEPM